MDTIAEKIINKNKEGLDELFSYFDDYSYQSNRRGNVASNLQKALHQCVQIVTERHDNGLQQLQQNIEENVDRTTREFHLSSIFQNISEKQAQVMDQLQQNIQDFQLSDKPDTSISSQKNPEDQRNQPLLAQKDQQQPFVIENRNQLDKPLLDFQEKPLIEEQKLPSQSPQEKKLQTENVNFQQYKAQLKSLEEDQIGKKYSASEVIEKSHKTQEQEKQNIFKNENEDDFYKAIQRRKGVQKAKNIFKINKSLSKKQNIKKQEEAESQMLANIVFLKNIKESKTSLSGLKKEWKQNSPQRKKTELGSLKMQKRKQIGDLGFSMVQSKESPMLDERKLVYQESNTFLPELKKQRKKGQIFRPAPYSIYSVSQKDNEVFYNNFK